MKRCVTYLLVSVCTLLSPSMSAQVESSYPLDTIDGNIYYRYEVERSIGLYRISVNFNVSQEEILRANPELQTHGLRYGETILIPAKDIKIEDTKAEDISVKEKQVEDTPVEDTPVEDTQIEDMPVEDIQTDDTRTMDDTAVIVPDTEMYDMTPSIREDSATLRLAYLLPLHAHAVKRDKNMERFYDFYAGSLIAIEEAQANGQSIEVYTYDVEKTGHKVSQALAMLDTVHVDAVIGPAYGQQVMLASAFAQKDSTLLLVPFSSKIEGIQDNPYVLQFNPSEQAEADTLARYLSMYGDSVQCIFTEVKENEVVPYSIVAIQEALNRYGVPVTRVPVRALLTDSLYGVLRPDVENIFFFNTEKFSNLQAVMPHLQLVAEKYPVTLFSHYSWQRESVALPQIYTSVFTQTPVVPEAYEALYSAYFGHTLSSTLPRYDLLGYDLTHHLLRLLTMSDSTDVTPSLIQEPYYGTQCEIEYRQVSPTGGYENSTIHVLRK